MKNFYLNKVNLKSRKQPFIIAEIGVNHGCSIKLAKKQILLAKRGGADAIKFQTYKAESLASKYSPSYWDLKKEKTKNQLELFKKFDKFKIKDYEILAKYFKNLGICFSTTPFDTEIARKINKLVTFFKIASADITNQPLLEEVAKTKKPIILSTGASNINEIMQAKKITPKQAKKKIIITPCILHYPTLNKNANLMMIKDLQEKFPSNYIGYSDHTLPSENMESLLISHIFGAKVIEKHFTHNKKLKGNDHYHAMDYKDLLKTRKIIATYNDLIGKKEKKPIKSEKVSRLNARRSLVASRNLSKGQIIKYSDILIKRPGHGISPMLLKKIVGKKLVVNLREDKIFLKKHFKNFE